jgi:hypothetical protein
MEVDDVRREQAQYGVDPSIPCDSAFRVQRRPWTGSRRCLVHQLACAPGGHGSVDQSGDQDEHRLAGGPGPLQGTVVEPARGVDDAGLPDPLGQVRRPTQGLEIRRTALGQRRDEVEGRPIGDKLERHVTSLTGDAEACKVNNMSHLHSAVPRYAVAAVLVRLSDEGSRVALTFLAVADGLGTGVGGLLVAVLLVPHVLAAPFVGTLVDRAPHGARRIAMLAAGFATALAAAAGLVGQAPLALVVVVLLAGGCCGPALTGGMSSVLPDLVPTARLPRAFGLDSLSYNVAGVAGPAVAAVLAEATSPELATLMLAISAAAGAGLLATLPARSRSVDLVAPPSPGWLAGARAIARSRALAAVTAATSLGQVGAGALPVIAVVVAVGSGHAGDAGLLLGAIALGGMIGSLLWTARPARASAAPMVVMAGLVAAGVPLVLAAATGSLSIRVALFVLSGIADGPLFGALLLTRQDRAPAETRSQVFTLGAGAKITAAAVGAAMGGALSSLAVGAQLAVAGGLQVVAGLVGAVAATAAQSRRAWCADEGR